MKPALPDPESRPVYIDHNATAPVCESVARAMMAALAQTGNPSSVHGAGRAARRIVETTRALLADRLGVAPEGVIFTASGSEANALALQGCAGHIRLASASEHDSVLANIPQTPPLPVDGQGLIRLDALASRLAALDGQPALISVMTANNETGVVQPVAAICQLAHAAGALVHCDAVQSFGRMPLDMAQLGADLMSVSAHKSGGPLGAAALLVRPGIDLRPLIRGGGQERGTRAGTENTPALAGWGALLAETAAGGELPGWAELRTLRDRLEQRLRAAGAVIIGADAPRLPNTSCLIMPGVEAAIQVIAFDLAGIAVSAGSACSSGRVKTSHVLRAMGLGEELANSAIRISLGPGNTPADIARAGNVWIALRDSVLARTPCATISSPV